VNRLLLSWQLIRYLSTRTLSKVVDVKPGTLLQMSWSLANKRRAGATLGIIDGR
jgi:hypothetical protein